MLFLLYSRLWLGVMVGERKWIEEDEDGRCGSVTVLPCHGGVYVVVALVMVNGDGGVEDGLWKCEANPMIGRQRRPVDSCAIEKGE